MQLAQFIQNNLEQLLEDWELAARETTPELKAEDRQALKDLARDMLQVTFSDVQFGNGPDPPRYSISGDQVAQEFRELRFRIVRAWGAQQRTFTAKAIDELMRFVEATDQFITCFTSGDAASKGHSKGRDKRLISAMLNAVTDPAAIFDPAARFLYLNSAMADLINGISRDIIGKTPRELGLDFAEELHNDVVNVITSGQPQCRKLLYGFPSGRRSRFDCELAPIFDDQNQVEAVFQTWRDVTERKRTEYQVWRHANFNSLTGITNRQLFLDRLDQTLLEAKRKGGSFALLFIDLGYFKQADDQLRHQNDGNLLALVAARITTRTRAMDTVARLGDDEFTLILKEADRAGAMTTARAILAGLNQDFEVDTHRLQISPSIGFTLFPDQGKDIDQLLHNADQAMCAAKEPGRQKVQAFETWMTENDSERTRINRELDKALCEGQLEVYFQPIVNIRTGATARAEALLRWNHPHRGLLTPASFLHITEQSGLIAGINDFVLEQARIGSLQWRDQSGDAFPVHINESPGSFDNRYLVEQWRAKLILIDLDESWITIELTPADFIDICAAGFDGINSLGLAGLRRHLALDDFSIEPLSLLALEEFRIGSVKIARKLIKGAGLGGETDRVLASLIAMAHGINAQVVAVGVETDKQLQFLAGAGCDYAQGLLFSPPLPRGDFGALLTRDRQTILT